MAQISLPYPHPGQQEVRRRAKRFNWLAAGRRWRKTTLVMSIAVEAALRGEAVFWGAPTYDQVRIGWDETRRAAGSVASFTQQRMMADFPTGGSIIYRSLDDPDNARGHTADGVIIDEAGKVKGRAWHEVLRPMILDTGGWGWFPGTPLGRNWFWREHQRSLGREDCATWQIPTLGVAVEGGDLVRRPHPLENPDIPFEEIYQIWRTVPERIFRQEILAEFIEDAGGVFRRVLDATTAEPVAQAQPGRRYAMGVDWGKFQDFTVIVVLDMESKELVAMDRFNQIDYTYQVGRLEVLYERFRPAIVIPERNSMGEPIIEQLERKGWPVQPFLTTNATKAAAIEALGLAFERGDIRILNDPVLIGELQAYEATRLASGMLRYGTPSGMHDDTVMALAMAWQAVAGHVGPSQPVASSRTLSRQAVLEGAPAQPVEVIRSWPPQEKRPGEKPRRRDIEPWELERG